MKNKKPPTLYLIDPEWYLLRTKDFKTKEEAENFLREVFKDYKKLNIKYYGTHYYRFLIHWDMMYDDGFYYEWTRTDKVGKGAMECYCFSAYDEALFEE